MIGETPKEKNPGPYEYLRLKEGGGA
jgi:hypothetical protein